MKTLRLTGMIWLCVGIVSMVYGMSSLDFDLLMPGLLVSLFFGLAGFFGYLVLRQRLWALWPLCAQGSLIFVIALIHLCTRPGESDWSLWSALLLSGWTIAMTAFVVMRSHGQQFGGAPMRVVNTEVGVMGRICYLM